MNCLGLSVISWAIFLSNFSRNREGLSRLLLGDRNVKSTSSGGGLRRFVEEGKSLE